MTNKVMSNKIKEMCEVLHKNIYTGINKTQFYKNPTIKMIINDEYVPFTVENMFDIITSSKEIEQDLFNYAKKLSGITLEFRDDTNQLSGNLISGFHTLSINEIFNVCKQLDKNLESKTNYKSLLNIITRQEIENCKKDNVNTLDKYYNIAYIIDKTFSEEDAKKIIQLNIVNPLDYFSESYNDFLDNKQVMNKLAKIFNNKVNHSIKEVKKEQNNYKSNDLSI